MDKGGADFWDFDFSQNLAKALGNGSVIGGVDGAYQLGVRVGFCEKWKLYCIQHL